MGARLAWKVDRPPGAGHANPDCGIGPRGSHDVTYIEARCQWQCAWRYQCSFTSRAVFHKGALVAERMVLQDNLISQLLQIRTPASGHAQEIMHHLLLLASAEALTESLRIRISFKEGQD
jgi:hypothetical protein